VLLYRGNSPGSFGLTSKKAATQGSDFRLTHYPKFPQNGVFGKNAAKFPKCDFAGTLTTLRVGRSAGVRQHRFLGAGLLRLGGAKTLHICIASGRQLSGGG
jgi:hypothetical protein